MDRKAYWNETYVKYWRDVTSEANDKATSKSSVKKIHDGDSKTAGEEAVFHTLDMMDYKAGEMILDYGCGFGRLVPYFISKQLNYKGIDISEAMIVECKRQYPDIADRFFVAEGEKLPFASQYFDKIICYGVFDACYQEQALTEMFRVLKDGGKLLLTGKNTNYHIDDEQAYIAEEAARAKGHPNFFTDVRKMCEAIQQFGFIENQRYFLYRGDTGKEKYVKIAPSFFYEWQLVITKNAEMSGVLKFSDEFSQTWKIKNKSN